jgi:N-acyl amino acid synthase of PEP-CTERM/exosortase system
MSSQEISRLRTSFKQYFEIVPAMTEELKHEAYHIRHSVYCEDLRYEHSRPNKLETDEYDAHALHLLIRDIRKNTFIGCTRIIRPSVEETDSFLPFEKACANTLDRSIVNPSKLPRNKIAEVSRLAVVSDYRRRKGESDSPVNVSEEDFGVGPIQRFPYIPLGLYYGTVELARINNIEILFMLIEERLANHFNKLGSKLEFIGAPVEHRGLRYPSMIVINDLINNLKPIIYPLYQAIAEDIRQGLITNLDPKYYKPNSNHEIISRIPT